MVDDHAPCSAIVFEDSNQWDVEYYKFMMCGKLFKIISMAALLKRGYMLEKNVAIAYSCIFLGRAF